MRALSVTHRTPYVRANRGPTVRAALLFVECLPSAAGGRTIELFTQMYVYAGWVRRYGFIILSCGLTPRQYTTHTLEGCHSPNTYNNPSTCIIHCSVNTPSQPDIQLAALNTANDIFWSPVISKHTSYSHKSTQWKNARERVDTH